MKDGMKEGRKGGWTNEGNEIHPKSAGRQFKRYPLGQLGVEVLNKLANL